MLHTHPVRVHALTRMHLGEEIRSAVGFLLSQGCKSQKESSERPVLVAGHDLFVFSALGPKYFSFVLCFLSLWLSVTSLNTKDGAQRVLSKTLLMFI